MLSLSLSLSVVSLGLFFKRGCFDANAWYKAHQETRGFHYFSQGYQDSALLSLSKHGIINVSRTYVEFGFHLKDVSGTSLLPAQRKHLTRHLMPGEIPPFGANTENLRQQGWTGVRFDGDESSANIPDLYQAFITPETVVSLFRRHGVPSNVDYVSIDIDSCDLWVLLTLTDVYRPRLLTIEYNAAFRFNESMTNVCTRPQNKCNNAFYSTKLSGTHALDGASLMAIAKAARRRGYEVVWVEPYLDVFVVRADLICTNTVPPLEVFVSYTDTPFHTKPSARAINKWFVEYE